MNNIENIQEYIPTVYVNDSEPDLDETNLNKTEQAIKRVTDAANKAIDALKQLDREKLALSAISNVLSDATDKVPSLALANTMQLAINDLNSNLGDVIVQSTYKTSLRSPAKTHTLGIHDNGTAYVDDNKVITNADLPILTVRTGTRYWTQYVETSGQKRIYFYNADFPSGENLLGYVVLTK
jgi:hypothetical protein